MEVCYLTNPWRYINPMHLILSVCHTKFFLFFCVYRKPMLKSTCRTLFIITLLKYIVSDDLYNCIGMPVYAFMFLLSCIYREDWQYWNWNCKKLFNTKIKNPSVSYKKTHRNSINKKFSKTFGIFMISSSAKAVRAWFIKQNNDIKWKNNFQSSQLCLFCVLLKAVFLTHL